MKNSGTKIIVLAIALIMAIAMATTTTLAWFSLNQEAAVDDFNIQIGTDQGLMISADGKNFYSTLTSEHIDGVYDRVYDDEVNEYGFRLTPVTLKLENTNDFILNDGNFVFQKINNNRNHLNYTTENFFVDAVPYASSTPTTGDYFVMTLYFRSDADMDVYMRKAQIESAVGQYTATGEAQTVPASLIGTDMNTYSNDANYLGGAKSFIDENDLLLADKYITAEAKNAMRLGVVGANTYVINPNPNSGYNVGNFAQAFYNAHGRYNTTDYQYMQDAYVYESNKVISDDAYANTKICELEENADSSFYEGSIKVFIWLDGTDGDCFDSVKTDIIRTWMRFEGVII